MCTTLQAKVIMKLIPDCLKLYIAQMEYIITILS
nr:MAG TPA: hypothetical protein [Caudoviricetes sp.]